MLSHVTPYFPGPGAETRAFCLARALRQDFDITFLLPDYGELNRPKLEALKDIANVETYASERKWSSLEWRMRQLLKPLDVLRPYWPLQTDPGFVSDIDWLLPALKRKLVSLDYTEFDLIHLVHPHLAPIFQRLQRNMPTTLDWIDERTVMLRRSLQLASSMSERLKYKLEIDRIMQFQARIGSLFDASFIASDVDADRLQSCMRDHRPQVVPNGVDLEYFRNPTVGRPDGNRLIFTGHMSYEPNVDGVLHFCREILPAIAKHVPGVHLFIVGMQPDPAILALEQSFPEHVTVTGSIHDVRPYLISSEVSVVPLRSGGGTRLKILEAMAMQRPVVSTAVGCEGLAVENRRHLLIQDDPVQFAEAVIEILKDPTLWNELAKNGRELVEQHYGWDVIAGTVANTWHDLIESKSQQGDAMYV